MPQRPGAAAHLRRRHRGALRFEPVAPRAEPVPAHGPQSPRRAPASSSPATCISLHAARRFRPDAAAPRPRRHRPHRASARRRPRRRKVWLRQVGLRPRRRRPDPRHLARSPSTGGGDGRRRRALAGAGGTSSCSGTLTARSTAAAGRRDHGEPFRIHGLASAPPARARVQELMELTGLNPEHYRPASRPEFSAASARGSRPQRALALKPSRSSSRRGGECPDVLIPAQIRNLMQSLQAEPDLTYLLHQPRLGRAPQL